MTRFLSLTVVVASAWAAAQPVVLVERRVAQYRDAAAAVVRQVKDAREVDLGDGDAAQAVKSASVVIAVGQKALAFAVAQGGGVPVVFCMVLGISSRQLSASVTGVPLEPDPAMALSHLKQTVPAGKRVGVVYGKGAMELHAAEAQRAAAAEGLTLVSRTVGGAGEVKDAVAGLLGSIDVLWLPPDPRLFPREVFSAVLAMASERKLPVMAFLSSLTEAGALASLHADYEDNGERAGKLALDILSRPEGKRLPVPAPIFAPGVLTLNLKTAKALQIEVPSKAQGNARQIIR